MDDEVVRVAMGLQLVDTYLSSSHCHLCRFHWDQLGTPGPSFTTSQGHHSRPSSIKDTVRHSLTSIKFPSHLEPTGFCCSNGKHPDRASIVPWKIVVLLGGMLYVLTPLLLMPLRF